MASRLRSTSSRVVAQEDTLIRMAVRPCHVVGPHQQVPSRWMRSITRRVVSASPNETSTWLRTTSLKNLATGGAQSAGEAPSVGAGAIDHLRQPALPERTESRPNLHAASAPG